MLDEERSAFDRNAFLRDVAERNLEVAAQCVIDICHRIVTLEGAQKPTDYYEAILRMGEIGVLPTDFAERLAPIAGFRNVLIHEYLGIDWDLVYESLHSIGQLEIFLEHINRWMRKRRNRPE